MNENINVHENRKEDQDQHCIIMLDVNNHPGVMSHITGLFSRRGFNLEAIMCGRIGVGKTSRMYLLVQRNDKVEQITHQLDKLYDVLSVTVCENCNTNAFENVQRFIGDDSWLEDCEVKGIHPSNIEE
jgi:acetolactate synthase I/III small subunit